MSLRAEIDVRRGPDGVRAAIAIGDGEALAVVGPNGAGKSTLLEALAGLVPMEAGEIELDGVRIEALPPERRRVGMCFQDAGLFPRLSVLENVAFPLRARGAGKRDARAKASALLEELAPRVEPAARPSRLSGGEQQRVALARALAAEPRLLLLDEPLAAVDVTARADMRRAIRLAVGRCGGPCIIVAHDPVDAMTMADRVVVLEAGRITQEGTPDEIRSAPQSPYAGDLVGVNLFEGTLEPEAGGAGVLDTDEGSLIVAWPAGVARSRLDDVLATLPPAEVSLHLDRPEGSPRNVLEGEIAEIAIHAERARVRVRSAPPITAEVTLGSVERLGLREGLTVFAACKAVEVRLRIDAPEPDTLGA
ncbi:MAG TPA: ABC transporter ATP-binding protein [Actinomycetota bacterium]